MGHLAKLVRGKVYYIGSKRFDFDEDDAKGWKSITDDEYAEIKGIHGQDTLHTKEGALYRPKFIFKEQAAPRTRERQPDVKVEDDPQPATGQELGSTDLDSSDSSGSDDVDNLEGFDDSGSQDGSDGTNEGGVGGDGADGGTVSDADATQARPRDRV